MKLTKRQLKKLIENYIYEQEDGAPPIDDEDAEAPPEEDGAPPPEEETEEEPEPEPETIKTPKSFKISVEGKEHTIAFKKESDKMVVYVDDTLFKKPKPSDMLTLAGLGLHGVEDADTKLVLSKIVTASAPDSMAKYDGDPAKIKIDISSKIKGSRPHFTAADIKAVISRAQG